MDFLLKEEQLVIEVKMTRQGLSDKELGKQLIEDYFQYLKDLKDVCQKLEIPFNESDRILFEADKRVNKDVKLDNY